MINATPDFPPFPGTEQLPQVLKGRIAAVAWEKAEGDETAFQRLCVQHVRGDIDLFADRPAETDATERVAAYRAQQEIERAALQPPAVVEPVAETAAIEPAEGRRPEPAARMAERDRDRR